MSDFGDWFRSVPFFTRYWLAATVGFSLLGRFGIFSGQSLMLVWEPLTRFQIWRLATSVFYYPITPSTGFHFLINLYFLYTYSGRLETGQFAGRPADYFFMLLFNWMTCTIIGLMVPLYLLLDPMVLSTLYVWCQLNKDVTVNFFFGTRFKAMYLPWVLLGFNMVISGGGIVEFIGILIGHLYIFLMFKLPQEMGGPSLLQTPAILKRYIPDNAGGVHGFGVPPQRPAAAAGFDNNPRLANNLLRRGFMGGGGHNWGQGQPLGGGN